MSKRIPGSYDHLKAEVGNKAKTSEKANYTVIKAFGFIIVIFIGLLLSGSLVDRPNHDMQYNVESVDLWEDDSAVNIDMLIFSDPGCECCHVYEDYLQGFSYVTRMEYPSNLADIKDYQGIPSNARSCHTIRFGDYFIEGHVPIEAITQLISTNPDIDGISLPQMPDGSPGMPGVKSENFEILSIKDGEVVSTFMIL